MLAVKGVGGGSGVELSGAKQKQNLPALLGVDREHWGPEVSHHFSSKNVSKFLLNKKFEMRL